MFQIGNKCKKYKILIWYGPPVWYQVVVQPETTTTFLAQDLRKFDKR
jgi:hypothetical protein